ncbi:MAG: efflux RND transporter periplasmic adaptor subunit [Desulfomonilaceae bacterium]|nr:efflux RND transporter periplasmic adaptor subunit [Desulfomonilaceae bacterium]
MPSNEVMTDHGTQRDTVTPEHKSPDHSPDDPRRRTLAIGLELAKRALRAANLEELLFILVNDSRALLSFDRSFLIVHSEGRSELVATSNQPYVEVKADLVKRVNKLAAAIKPVEKALVLLAGNLRLRDLPEETAAALQSFIEYSGCSTLMLVPINSGNNVVGHLLFEFFSETPPGEIEAVTLLNMIPFFGSALTEKWLLDRNKFVRTIYNRTFSKDRRSSGLGRYVIKAVLLLLLAVVIVTGMFAPLTLKVGGEAEVVPDMEYFAYVERDGIVKEVYVREGEIVGKDSLLAVLDSQELDYEIRKTQRMMESYQTEIAILRNMGAEDPTKLAESKLVSIKAERSRQEMEFLNWQRQFLQIKAPLEGTVLTQKVETLVGKRFKAGEPFCSIAPHEHLSLDIFLNESDTAYVKPDQTAVIYFNFQPDEGRRLRVKSVAPKSETLERLGAVFRVRAEFEAVPLGVRPGMKGIAQIDTEKSEFWFVVTRRLRAKLNELMLLF